jgi:hypothetical protein
VAAVEGENRSWSLQWDAYYHLWRMHDTTFGMFSSQICLPATFSLVEL